MESTEIVLSTKKNRTIKKKYSGVTVKVYFSEEAYIEMIKLTEKAGKRRVGLEAYTQKSHGFANQKVANTDGIARFLKMAAKYWGEHQQEMEIKAKLLREEQEKLAGYGVKIK